MKKHPKREINLVSCISEKNIGFVITLLDSSKDFLCARIQLLPLCLVWFVIKFAIKRKIQKQRILSEGRSNNNEL